MDHTVFHKCLIKQTNPVYMCEWVEITDTPVYMRERGGGGRVECGLRSDISGDIHT